MAEITINRNKCEGKADCLDCPESVFELQVPDPKELSWIARFKVKVHGGKQAFAVRPQDCTGCNLCVETCPEKAITVV